MVRSDCKEDATKKELGGTGGKSVLDRWVPRGHWVGALGASERVKKTASLEKEEGSK